MPVMVLVWDWQLERLKDRGIIVKCAQCQHATELDGKELKARGTGIALCPILRVRVELDQALLCTEFKERGA